MVFLVSNSVLKIKTRYIFLSVITNRGNNTNQRRIMAGSRVTGVNTKAMDLKAKKNRFTWEEEKKATERFQGRRCSDDVYFMSHFEKIKYPITEAIINHQEFLLDKSMLDSPKSVLKANFTFNMRTKKTAKFAQKVDGVVRFPFKLEFLEETRVVAFCTSPEEAEIAMQFGAFAAGDMSLVKKIESGELFYEEFDQVVCHVDFLNNIVKLRAMLKDRMPSKMTPDRIGNDIGVLVDRYVNGFEFESTKVEGIQEEAILTVPLGQICWPVEHLVQNYRSFLAESFLRAPSNITGDLVSKLTLTCPPSDEVFLVDVSEDTKEFVKTIKKRKTENEVDSIEE